MQNEIDQDLDSEKRLEQRRKEPDRRDLVRYETEKNPRRKNNGRRHGELKDIWDKR